MGDLHGALEAYARAKEEFPYVVVAYSGYAAALRDLGDIHGAIAA